MDWELIARSVSVQPGLERSHAGQTEAVGRLLVTFGCGVIGDAPAQK